MVRRLFSTFARGWPGVGLLVMRIVAGAAFMSEAVATLHGWPSMAAAIGALSILAALGLLAGFWTPIAGALLALIGLWRVLTHADDTLASVLLATMSVALALLGPGAWSIDARLFGWKRIDVRERRR